MSDKDRQILEKINNEPYRQKVGLKRKMQVSKSVIALITVAGLGATLIGLGVSSKKEEEKTKTYGIFSPSNKQEEKFVKEEEKIEFEIVEEEKTKVFEINEEDIKTLEINVEKIDEKQQQEQQPLEPIEVTNVFEEKIEIEKEEEVLEPKEEEIPSLYEEKDNIILELDGKIITNEQGYIYPEGKTNEEGSFYPLKEGYKIHNINVIANELDFGKISLTREVEYIVSNNTEDNMFVAYNFYLNNDLINKASLGEKPGYTLIDKDEYLMFDGAYVLETATYSKVK